jgi:hypothetical protein
LEPELAHRKPNIADREKVKINKRLSIYLFFLFISIALWYLNALSKNYTAIVSYRVHYDNFPKGKALISDMPEKLDFKVKGLGFSVLKHKILGYKRIIDLPIDNFRLDISRKDNQYNYYLLTRYIKEWVGNQLTSDVQVIDIKPDTLIFKFADVVEKKVPVRPSLNLQFEKQFMQNGSAIIAPDSVIVSGPQVLMDTLAFVLTKELQIKHLKDTSRIEAELLISNKLNCPTSKISLTIPVEKYTELDIPIQIESINVPDGLRVRMFPATVKVFCWVGVSSYDKMTPYMFRAIVDYNSLISNSQSKVKIELVKTPPNAQNIRFYPKSVEYIIEK